jgi:hypothetical protein
MNLYLYDIGERARKVSRFIGHVRAELRRALVVEKASRKLTQQQIATMIGTSRSVVNREFMGLENLTLRRVAELAWALNWDISFELRKPQTRAAPIISIAQMPHLAGTEPQLPQPAKTEPQLDESQAPKIINFRATAA